jgi:hypothetical protein
MRELTVIFTNEPGWHLVPDLVIRLYPEKQKGRLSWPIESASIIEALARLTPQLSLEKKMTGRSGQRGRCLAYRISNTSTVVEHPNVDKNHQNNCIGIESGGSAGEPASKHLTDNAQSVS